MPDIVLLSLRGADGGAKLLLQIDNKGVKEVLTVLTARLSHLPQAGELEPSEYEMLCREDETCRAITAGLRMLGANGSSAHALARKIAAKGISPQAALCAVEELEVKGYLNEKENCLREAERDLKKFWGDRRILADLSAKGYGRVSLQEAGRFLRQNDQVERLAKLLRKKRISLPGEEGAQRKLFGSLARYGYGTEEIKKALLLVFG